MSSKHYKLLYADTGIYNFLLKTLQVFVVDSLYWAQCCENLEEMIQKYPNDSNHYSEDEIVDELKEWDVTKKKFFVCGSTPAEKREPLKWKEEFSTSPDDQGEMICLSPYVIYLIIYFLKLFLVNAILYVIAARLKLPKKVSKRGFNNVKGKNFWQLYMKIKFQTLLTIN